MKRALSARWLRVPAILAAAATIFAAVSLDAPRPVEALTNCTYTDTTFDSEEQAFLAQINAYRAQNSLGALTVSTNLNRAAGWLANDMATKNYMDHTDSLGRSFGTRMQQCDTQYGSAAENIAAGYTTGSSVFTGWKNSSGHNTNMLGAAYKQIGIARVYSATSTYGWYWATDFSSVDDGTRVGGGSTPPAATATATATRTSTPASNATSTRTPTRTSTPRIATATRTSTPRPAATATRTATAAAPTATAPSGTSAKAVMTSPAPGTRFAGTSATFNWSAATNASEYFFYMGTTVGGNQMFGQSMGLNRSVTLNSLPQDGRTLYVRLWTRVGNTWSYNDYTYRAK